MLIHGINKRNGEEKAITVEKISIDDFKDILLFLIPIANNRDDYDILSSTLFEIIELTDKSFSSFKLRLSIKDISLGLKYKKDFSMLKFYIEKNI